MAITQIQVASPANEVIFTDTAMGATVDAIKASAATVYYIQVDNSANNAASYVKLYNVASGSVTVGTTAPDVVILAPASARITAILSNGASPGVAFGTALSAACVTTAGTGGTSPPSSSVIVNVVYA